MDILLTVNIKPTTDIKEATHIVALRDYGKIKRGDFVPIWDFCGVKYVWDMDADEENDLLQEYESNLLFKVEKEVRN